MKYKVLGNEPEGASEDIRNPAKEESTYPEKWDEDYEEVLIEKKEKENG